jgi:hypothetical protein
MQIWVHANTWFEKKISCYLQASSVLPRERAIGNSYRQGTCGLTAEDISYMLSGIEVQTFGFRRP